jgi:hypothetical protein
MSKMKTKSTRPSQPKKYFSLGVTPPKFFFVIPNWGREEKGENFPPGIWGIPHFITFSLGGIQDKAVNGPMEYSRKSETLHPILISTHRNPRNIRTNSEKVYSLYTEFTEKQITNSSRNPQPRGVSPGGHPSYTTRSRENPSPPPTSTYPGDHRSTPSHTPSQGHNGFWRKSNPRNPPLGRSTH